MPQTQDATLRIDDLIKLGSSLTVNELAQIKDFGPVITEAIVQWFQDKTNTEFLKKLAAKGVSILAVPNEVSKQFQGLTFVFTGELKTMTRDQAKEAVINRGGEVSENVSKKTSFVVVGENPGSKYQKAQKLGVQIISETEFLKML